MSDKTFPGPRVRKLEVEDTTVRSLRIRFTDLEKDEDPFLRYEIMAFDYHSQTSENLVEPIMTSIFVDTGASINTISRHHQRELEQRGIVMKHTYSAEPIQLQLVGGKQLRTSGDFVEFDIQVGTSAGIQLHTDKFFILEQDSEH